MYMQYFRSSALLSAAALCGSCGYGPLETCSSPCDDPNLRRDLFCDCVPKDSGGSTDSSPPALALITTGGIADADCGICGGGQSHFLGNATNQKIEVVVRTERRDSTFTWPTEITTDTHILSPDGMTGDRKFLGCHGAEGPTGICSLSYQRNIVSAKYIDDEANFRSRYNSLRFNFARLTRQIEGRHLIVEGISCQNECNTPNSPYCVQPMGNSGTGELISQLEQTRVTILPAQSSIEPETFMSIFGADENPCERGNVELSIDTASNSGRACTLAGNIAIGIGGSDVEFAISVPPTVEARREGSSFSVDLNFDEPQLAPYLQLKDPDLQADWGGVITRVQANPNNFIIETTAGCIRVSGDST